MVRTTNVAWSVYKIFAAQEDRAELIKEKTSISPQTEQDANEFGIHVRQGGWRMGLLVARNVYRGKIGGDTTKSIAQLGNANGKVTANEFAKLAGLSGHSIVLRYLDAWNKYAERGEYSEVILPKVGIAHCGTT